MGFEETYRCNIPSRVSIIYEHRSAKCVQGIGCRSIDRVHDDKLWMGV
jgi:hypothetical protein